MGAAVLVCDCGNNATDVLASGAAACEWCAAHDGHRAPRSMTFRYSHLGGNPVADCSRCGFSAVYWECGCELVHDCAADTFAAWDALAVSGAVTRCQECGNYSDGEPAHSDSCMTGYRAVNA